MHEIVRRALADPSQESYKHEVNENRGPVFLLANAIGIVVVTYLASHSSLDISRALKAYDRLVLAVRAPPSPKGRKWKLAIAFLLFLVAEFALVWYMVKTNDDTVMSYVMMLAGTFISLAGFRSILAIRGAPTEIYRHPLSKNAYPKVVLAEKPKVSDKVATGVLVVMAVYTGLRPTAWATSLVILGLVFRVIRGPFSSGKALSVRGVVYTCLGATLYCVVVAAAAIGFANSSHGTEEVDTHLDKHTSRSGMPEAFTAWDRCSLQFWGAATGILTALILRYEYSISSVASELEVEQSLLAPSASPSIVSAADAKALRVPIPKSHASFPAPLFHSTLFVTFLVHIPSIVLSTSALTWVRTSPEVPIGLRIAAHSLVVLPAQLWMIVALPLTVGVAVLIRKDGKALWSYWETALTKTEPAIEDIENVDAEPVKRVEVVEPYTDDIKA